MNFYEQLKIFVIKDSSYKVLQFYLIYYQVKNI